MSFQNANELMRKKYYRESLKIYESLSSADPSFAQYSKNAAASAQCAGLYEKSGLNHLNAYLANGRDYHALRYASIIGDICYKTTPLVLVLIPAFNASETIDKSIDSVLSQDHDNTIICVIDDASTDDTRGKLAKFNSNPNVFIIRSSENIGAFCCVNIGLFLFRHSKFDYFIKHDADDLMKKEKLKRQISLLTESVNSKYCTSGYVRLDPQTGDTLDGKRRGHNMTLYRHEVFLRLGYFDSTRFGGDSEYLERAMLAFGDKAEIHTDERLTAAYLMPGGLTANNPLGSEARQNYMRQYRAAHIKMKEEDFYYRSCELRSRYLDHIREQRKIIAGVATVENRKNALQECLLSLANQVDEIYLYQNGYDEEVKHNLSCKLYVNNSLKTKIDMGDAGKFYKIDDPGDVYYFSADDDLIYPRNYIDSYIDILYTCNDEIIVTSHGRICHSRVENYYDDKYKLFHYAAYQPTFEPVHFGGTGVMGFRTGRMRVRFSDFPVPNMADIWMGLLAKSFRTPIYVVPRHLDWIKSSEKFDLNTTIYRSRKSTGIDDKIAPHIKLMNFEFVGARVFQRRSFKEYKVISVASKNYILYSNFPIAVAIPTYNRPKLLVRLLKQIDQAAKGFNVNIYVFDDGSEQEASVTIDGIRDELRNISNITVTRFENHGKKRYWQLVNLIFERLEESNSKYFYYLGDDLEVAETFFEESIHAWESIQDEKKMSLNLLCDSRTKSWTDFERVKVDFDEFSVYQNQWLDMIMMCDSKLVGQRVDPISLSRWDVKPLLSSGVGAQLSTRLHSTGKSMYQVIRSLVQHGNHDSLMNPEERRLNPLVAKS